MKNTLLLILFLFCSFGLYAQDAGTVGEGVEYTPENFANQTSVLVRAGLAFLNMVLVYLSFFFLKLRGVKKLPAGINVTLISAATIILGFGAKVGIDSAGGWLSWVLANLDIPGLAVLLYEVIFKRLIGKSSQVAAG